MAVANVCLFGGAFMTPVVVCVISIPPQPARILLVMARLDWHFTNRSRCL